MKKLVIAVAFTALSQVSFAQEKPSKEDVMQVIERSGGGGQLDAAKDQILAMIPKEKQAAFLLEFNAMINKVKDTTAEVYMQEYTKADIKAMLDFYNSPVGKKIGEKSKIIAEKSQEAMVGLQGEVQALVMKYMQ